MKNLYKSLGIVAGTAVIGLVFAGCKWAPLDTSPKTLVIQNIPANVFVYGQSGGGVGIFEQGTTAQEALSWIGLVAGADLSNDDVTVEQTGQFYTVTLPLYNSNDDNRWTGSGTYDIYVWLDGGGGYFYKVSSVTISTETTAIPFGRASEIFPGTGGNTGAKALVIQNIPANVYAYGEAGGEVGIFEQGTTAQEAFYWIGLVAGSELSNDDVTVVGAGPYTVTLPLYDIYNNRWTGSGTYDIYVWLAGGGGRYYKAGSVNISAETTTILFSKVIELYEW
jgi:hypothetical protein